MVKYWLDRRLTNERFMGHGSAVHEARPRWSPPRTGPIFAQPTGPAVPDQLDTVAALLATKFPAVTAMLTDAKADLTAFADFPEAHWKKLWSTNPLERLNKEIKRRTDVVGIFPNPPALFRLAGAVLVEAHDEWQASDRRYLPETSMAALFTPPTPLPTRPEEAPLPELATAQ